MTLKDKVINTGIIKLNNEEVKRFNYFDVKEAVLELKSKIYLRQEKNNGITRSEILILNDIDNIFGDFEK